MMKRQLMTCCAGALLLLMGCQDAWTQGMMGKQDHAGTKAAEPDPSQIEPEPEPKILPSTYVAAGQLAEGRGDMAMAITMYRKAVAVGKDHVVAYNKLGLALTKIGRHKQAEGVFQSAVQVGPDKPFLHNNLAYAYIAQRQWDKAEEALNTALKLQPDFSRARVNLGLVMARTGRYDQAMKQFLLVLPPASAHYNLGLMYETNRRYELASQAFSQALALDPNLGPAKAALKRVEGTMNLQAFETPDTALAKEESQPDTQPDDAAVSDGEPQLNLPQAETASTVVTETSAKQQAKDELILIEPGEEGGAVTEEAPEDLSVPERVLPAPKAGKAVKSDPPREKDEAAEEPAASADEIRLPEARPIDEPIVTHVELVRPDDQGQEAESSKAKPSQQSSVELPTSDPEQAQRAAAETLGHVLATMVRWWNAPKTESAWQRVGRHFGSPTADHLASVDEASTDASILIEPQASR